MPETLLDFAEHKERWGQILVAKKDQLEAELAVLEGVKGKSTQRQSIKGKLHTVVKELAELETVSNRTTRYLELVELMKLEGTLFNAGAVDVYFERPTASSGPGELTYRIHHGLDVTRVGASKGRDVPEHGDAEIKSIFTVQKRLPTKDRPWTYEVYDWDKLRAGQTAADLAKDAIYDVIWELVRLGEIEGDVRKYNTTEMKAVVNGSLSEKERAKLPPTALDIVMSRLRPSVGLGDCPLMILTLPEGWLTIPFAEYDEAFDVVNVSKGLVSYILRIDYVRGRRERFLAAASASAAEPATSAAQ